MRTEKEVNEIISNVYKLQSEAELKEEDIAWGKKVFQEPEDFHRLRRILRVITDNERGITWQEELSSVPDSENHEKFAFDVKVHNAVNEKIRNALLGFYSVIMNDLRTEKKKEIEAEEAEKKKENDNLKEMEKAKEQIAKPFGKNL